MNRKFSYLGNALLFLLGSVAPAHGQTGPAKDAAAKQGSLPSADELAEKCAKGSGGKEAWAKLSTLIMTGTMQIPAANLTGKIEIYAKAPNKNLQIVTLADGQFVQKQGFDGRVAWKSDPQSGLKQLEGAELEEARIEAIFDSDVRLKEIYPDMKVTGRSKVGDREAYTVLAPQPGGKTLTFYFDAQTGVRLGIDSEGPDATGNTVKNNLLFEDYRTVAGIQIPFLIRGSAGGFNFEIHLEEAKPNQPVDDAMFAKPSSN